MAQRKSNEQWLKQVMSFSRYGALSQVFIMQAIEKYADAVVKADPKAIDNGFINGETWRGVAQEILESLRLHYGEK